jgi:hypothetical protein
VIFSILLQLICCVLCCFVIFSILLQDCEVPKSISSDDKPYARRSKERVAQQLKSARLGDFPGWNMKQDKESKIWYEDPNAIMRPLVDANGIIVSQTRLAEAERKLGLVVMDNSTFHLPLFDPYQQCPNDPMHLINLGLWIHILSAIMFGIFATLSFKRQNGTQIISNERIGSIFQRLGSRMEGDNMHHDTTGVHLSERVKTFAADMWYRSRTNKSKVCVVEAREHFQLMMVSLFCIILVTNMLFCCYNDMKQLFC